MELKLNLDEYENVIVYKSLTDEKYLTSIIDIIKPEYFKDKNIKTIFGIIKAFYVKNNTVPTVTELKTYINGDEVKEAFKVVLRNFTNIDKNFNEEELINNTERYIKERAIYTTMLDVAEDVSSGKIDTSYILDKFEKSSNVNLKSDIGLDLFNNFDAVVDDQVCAGVFRCQSFQKLVGVVLVDERAHLQPVVGSFPLEVGLYVRVSAQEQDLGIVGLDGVVGDQQLDAPALVQGIFVHGDVGVHHPLDGLIGGQPDVLAQNRAETAEKKGRQEQEVFHGQG